MRLFNVRREGGMVHADFRSPDGRIGSVSCSSAEFAHLADEALLTQARWIVRELRKRDEYVAPGRDRFSELD